MGERCQCMMDVTRLMVVITFVVYTKIELLHFTPESNVMLFTNLPQ